MIQLTPQMRLLLAVEPVDFRKGIDGLAQVCRQSLQVDRVASVRVCDGVSASVVVFAPDYGNENNNRIDRHLCRRRCASSTRSGSLAQTP